MKNFSETIKDELIKRGYKACHITYNGKESDDCEFYLGDSIQVNIYSPNISVRVCGTFIRYISNIKQLENLYLGITDKKL